MTLEPIHIRLTARDPQQGSLTPQEAFWKSVVSQYRQEQTILQLENDLVSDLGPQLHQRLVEKVSEPMRLIQRSLDDGAIDRLERLLSRRIERPESGADGDEAKIIDAYSRLLTHRERLTDNPTMLRLQERIIAASLVIFHIRIASYSSLNLDLTVSSIRNIADAFENDFESFRVFLEVFIPRALSGTFVVDSDKLECAVNVPPGYAEAFEANSSHPAPVTPLHLSHANAPVTAPSRSPEGGNAGRERAEWLWRLANGSLLIPVLIALVVMYFAITYFQDLIKAHNQALEPIFKHQLEMLKEDRRRLIPDAPADKANDSDAGKPAN